MKTAQEIEKEFKEKLSALLAEYDAEIDADSYWTASGDEVQMIVSIPIKDNVNAAFVEINLGSNFG